jgi:hypothetical protein
MRNEQLSAPCSLWPDGAGRAKRREPAHATVMHIGGCLERHFAQCSILLCAHPNVVHACLPCSKFSIFFHPGTDGGWATQEEIAHKRGARPFFRCL